MSDVVVSIGGNTAELDRTVGKALNSFGKLSSQAAGRARVFANALGVIETQGGKAAQVLGSLLGGFAAGGAMGLALGGMNALVSYFRETKEEAEKAATASEALVDSIEKGIRARQRSLAAARAKTPEEVERLSVGDEVASQQEEIGRQYDEAVKKLSEFEVRRRNVIASTPALALADSEELKAVDRQIAFFTSKLRELERSLATIADTADANIGKIEAKQSAANAKREAEGDRLAAEAHIWAWEEYKAAEEAIEAITEAEEQAREEERAAEEDVLERNLQAERDIAEMRVQVVEDMAQQYERALQPIANGLSNLFTGIALEGQKASEALASFLRSMAAMVVNTLVQMGVQRVAAKLATHAAERPVAAAEVTSAAGRAGAEGAAAVAGIPVVGPAMAAGVLASLPATIIGSMMPLAVARGGWEVPSFGSAFPAILHPKETVIPAWGKEALKNMAEMPPGGGGGITVNVGGAVMSDRDLERTLTARDGAVSRALRKMERRRRR